MTTLYDMTGQYLALAELADDPNMPEDALTDSLEGITGEIEEKAQALLQVVAGMEGDTGAIDREIERLKGRKQIIQNRANRLRQYLFDNMVVSGINKISCSLFQITLTKPRPMVVIRDLDSVPEKYIKTTTTKAPIKKEILAALKAGKSIAGCGLGESKRSLRVK
jgi:hypothetical protein